MDDLEVAALMAEQAASTPTDVMQMLASQARDDDLRVEERLAACEHLGLLFSRYPRTLKLLVDARQLDSFRRGLETWAKALRYWPRYDEDFNDDAQVIKDAGAGLVARRDDGVLQLGAWYADRYSTDLDSRGSLRPYLQTLAQHLSSTRSIVDVLVAHRDQPYALLEEWYSDAMMAQRVSSWSGERSPLAMYWAALLFLSQQSAGVFEIEPFPGISGWSEDFNAALQRAESEAPLWEWLISQAGAVHVSERAEHIRTTLANAVAEQESRDRRAIAAAALDIDVVETFRMANSNAFARSAVIRSALGGARVSRVTREDTTSSPVARGISQVFPKEWFLADQTTTTSTLTAFGEELARDQDDRLYDQISRSAADREWDGSFVEALKASATELMLDAEGLVAVLAPEQPHIREMLWAADDFQFHRARGSDAFSAPTTPDPFGFIADVPIYLVPTSRTGSLVVLALDAVSLEERVPPEGDVPLRIEVSEISSGRASQLVTQGFKFANEPDWDPEQISSELQQQHVLVEANADYELQVERPSLLKGFAIPSDEDSEESDDEDSEKSDV